MHFITRSIDASIHTILAAGKSVLLLGPRQTGKTTLLTQLSYDFSISLIDISLRVRYEKEPSLLADEIRALESAQDRLPLVVVDEVQKVPDLMNVIQQLIDEKVAQFIITGSSARKLMRDGDMNLLPGRVIAMRLDSLSISELKDEAIPLTQRLLDGTLPEIVLTQEETLREHLLEAYVTIYLEEEVRAEALVRHLNQFSRFLELAASESGKLVNYLKLAKEIGVSHTTIQGYYQILEDCLIVERVEPYLKTKTRRKLTKSQKYIFFDLGVRRLAAYEGRRLPAEQMGHLFEQFIGLELIHAIRCHRDRMHLHYWRDHNGPEVDWVIEKYDTLIPIEVKWTTMPNLKDAKHLVTFMDEYDTTEVGYIICRTPHVMKLSDTIYAYPWERLLDIAAFTAD